jgi:HK97 family phage prohead protease
MSMKVIYKRATATFNETANGFDAIFSSERLGADRQDDLISLDGMDRKAYEENPVLLYQHEAPKGPIGTCSGLHISGHQLRGKIHLAPASTSSRLREIHGLIAAKALKALSIGFIVKSPPEPMKNGGFFYGKTQLAEISLVSVPCNTDCLLQAKSFGVSSETIRKIFRENQNAPRTIGERIAEAKRNVKHYSKQEKDRILRKAKAQLADKQPKMLTMSEERRQKNAHNRETHRRAKVMLEKRQYLRAHPTKDPSSRVYIPPGLWDRPDPDVSFRGTKLQPDWILTNPRFGWGRWSDDDGDK